MLGIGLAPEEVAKRLVRLNNLEKLYAGQKTRIRLLEEQVLLLKRENELLRKENMTLHAVTDDLKLQIEELRTIVFGRKKKKGHGGNDDSAPPKAQTPRSSDSYKRPVPQDEDVTESVVHPLDQCACGSATTGKHTVVFYEEDIPIPSKKIVRKHIVDRAYCPVCKKWLSSIPLPNHKVILGRNVQKYICYLSAIARLSFTQIQHLLQDTYSLPVSQGEIVKILEKEAVHLGPLYEQLKERIRGEPVVHLDETGWKLLQGGDQGYAWVMSGAESNESVFLAGVSRGKGNADTLLGENFDGFVVSDDYGAYKKLPKHQLCWAHVLRKFRDMAQSGEISDMQRQRCKDEYAKLCAIYDDLKRNRTIERYDDFAQRLTLFSAIMPDDPRRLIRIKTTLRKNIPNYLTCLSDPRIPLTNNQAERSLRHLVLKRKISFGSLTKRTAENFAVLASVLLSLRQRYQSGFFGEYLGV